MRETSGGKKTCSSRFPPSSTHHLPLHSSRTLQVWGIMQRTATTTRTLEEERSSELLPTFDPLSEVAKKEISRVRSAEKAVHVIPLVLLACALVLWFFSSPHIPMETKVHHGLAERNPVVDGISHKANSDLVAGRDQSIHGMGNGVRTGIGRKMLMKNIERK